MANEFKVKKGLIVTGSGSTIFDVQGSQGQLFSVTDSLVGELFSVNDISGIPIMTVSSDETINMGTYGDEAIKISGDSTYVKTIKTTDLVVRPNVGEIGVVTESTIASIYFDEERVDYTMSTSSFWSMNYVPFYPIPVYEVFFPWCNSEILTGDVYVKLSVTYGAPTPITVESGLLTIDNQSPPYSCRFNVVDDANAQDFFNNHFQNAGQGTVYAKIIPAGNRDVNVLKTDLPTIAVDSDYVIDVTNKDVKYFLTPDNNNNNSSRRNTFFKSNSYPNLTNNYTVEMWATKDDLTSVPNISFEIQYNRYNDIFNINNYFDQVRLGNNSYSLSSLMPVGSGFNKLTHLAVTFEQTSSVDLKVTLFIDGINVGSGTWTDYWSIGFPSLFGNTDVNQQPIFISAKIYKLKVSDVILYTSDFTPTLNITRDPNTVYLYDGNIYPVTYSDLVYIPTGYALTTENKTDNSTFQDETNGVALVSWDLNVNTPYPAILSSIYTYATLGGVIQYNGTDYYSPLYNGIYEVGDNINYSLRYSDVSLFNTSETSGKTIRYDSVTDTIDYGGLILPITSDLVNNNIYTDRVTIPNNSVYNILIGTVSYPNSQTESSVSIGYDSYITPYSVSIGRNAKSMNNYGVSIGYNAYSNSNSVCVGYNSQAQGNSAVAIGTQAWSNNSSAIAIGQSSYVNGVASIAIGQSNQNYGQYSISLGHNTKIDGNGSHSIALGYGVYNNVWASFIRKTTPDTEYPNSRIETTFYAWNGGQTVYTGKRYISRNNNLTANNTPPTAGDVAYAFDLQQAFRGKNSWSYGALVTGKMTVMIRRNGVTDTNEWKVVEINFILNGSSSNLQVWSLTIVSTTTIANGAGTNQALWTPSIELVSNRSIVFAVDKGTSTIPVTIVGHLEMMGLNAGYSA